MEMRQEQRHGFCVRAVMHLSMLFDRTRPRRTRTAQIGLILTLGLNLTVQFAIAISPLASF